jgi:predicted N-formylglutamate amidohydrolase
MSTSKLTGHFTAKSGILGQDEALPFIYKPGIHIPGQGRILFSAPHRGDQVPQRYRSEDGTLLGMAPEWFKRHEAVDIGIKELFRRMAADPFFRAHALLGAEYSRLVVEKGRNSANVLTTQSTDTGDLIAGNLDVVQEERLARIAELYTPYFAALAKAFGRSVNLLDENISAASGFEPAWMQAARNINVPEVIASQTVLLDMHSFTRVFRGETREVCIGTVVFENHELAETLAALFRHACNGQKTHDNKPIVFTANEPYDLRGRDFRGQAVAESISAALGIPYTAIEMRNDLLTHPQDRETMYRILQRVTAGLLEHPGFASFTRRDAPMPEGYKPDPMGIESLMENAA